MFFGVLAGALLILWDHRLRARCVRIAAEIAVSGDRTLAIRNREKERFRLLDRRRRELVEPLIGAYLISSAALLLATLVAGKLNPDWTRPFLAPPLLVTQVLQHRSAQFAQAFVTSGSHMLLAITYGLGGGLAVGYLLARFQSIGRWTAWHLISVSALPPIFLKEMLRQFVKSPSVSWLFPVTEGEVAFRLGTAMATWAVVWPVVTATVLSLSRIDREHRLSIRLLGARSTWQQLRHLEIPELLLPVLRNLRIGFVIGLIVLIAGEEVGSPPSEERPSLGSLSRDLLQAQKVQELLALLCLTTAFVLSFEAFFRLLERLLLRRSRLLRPRSQDGHLETAANQRRECLARFEDQSRVQWRTPLWRSENSPSERQEAAIELGKIWKSFGTRLAFVEKGFRRIEPGTFVSIIGRSGAGKSTILKLIVGLETAECDADGCLRVGGVDMLGVGAADSVAALSLLVSYVAQRPLLLPHLDVERNVLFGLRQQWRLLSQVEKVPSRALATGLRAHATWLLGLERNESPEAWRWSDEKAKQSPLGQLVKFVGLDEKMRSQTSELSGGEAQRVHLLRWLVLGRPILLLDEAFSALDQPLKALLRDLVRLHAKRLGSAVVNVSHDRADVLQCSDRILFVEGNTIVGDGPPERLFFEPASRELAVFLGHTNLFLAVSRDPNAVELRSDLYRDRPFDPPVTLRLRRPCAVGDTPVQIFIAHSDVNILRVLAAGEEVRRGQSVFMIDEVRFTGAQLEIRLSRPARSGAAMHLDCVFQEDDLRARVDPTFAASGYRRLEGMAAEVEIDRALLIGNASEQ